MVISTLVGAAELGSAGGATPNATGGTLHLMLESRLPRSFAALLAGSAMAVAGVIMQQLVRNRFVEPSTTGTTEGAMLGLIVITLLAPGAPVMVKMVVAAGTALMAAALFLALVRRLSPRDPFMVPLVGMIWSGILGAGASWFAWQADLVQYLGNWMTGDFSGVIAGRYELLWIAGAVALLAYFAADMLTIAGMGEGTALSLGLNYRGALRLGLVAVSLVTALVVVTVGAIPFIGLVVPNIVARLMGDRLRASLPVVAVGGAILVLSADIIGRLIRYPYEIPVGTVAGVLGAAIFLWLLSSKPRRHRAPHRQKEAHHAS